MNLILNLARSRRGTGQAHASQRGPAPHDPAVAGDGPRARRGAAQHPAQAQAGRSCAVPLRGGASATAQGPNLTARFLDRVPVVDSNAQRESIVPVGYRLRQRR